jgi:hypothetical protein
LSDTDTRKDTSLTLQRLSQSNWPDLEAALFEWQQKMQGQKAVITGDTLKQKAHEIWHLLPQYHEQPEPKWSNGWLTNFKNRFHIKEYVCYGEGGTADIDSPENIKQMQENRDLAATYPPENVLNMDETGLFWKLSPNRTLATEASNGGRKSKDRITLALTVNATGTDKWEPWLIGKSENPRCFKHINRQLLGVQYRYNNSKWMTGVICAEYLHWVNRKCSAQGRHVLLFMDNFSGHQYGVDLVGGKQALSHVRVEWLPPNTTSHWQPADQGIISAFKLHYRKQWVSYMIKQFEADKDPNKTVTLLHTVNWTVHAWNNHVKASTITNCWYKSSLIAKPLLGGDLDAHGEIDLEWATQQAKDREIIETLQSTIQRTTQFNDPLPISQFIAPIDEEIVEDESMTLEVIVNRYAQGGSRDTQSDIEEEEEQEEIREVKLVEAIAALDLLNLYEK